MKLLVSIHDVAPPFAASVASLWQLCREYDVPPALLVVPNWHGVAPLAAAPEFVAWIRARRAEGADVLLHGERHDEEGSPRGPVDHARALGRTAAEGEFLTLGAPQALRRILRGLTALRSQGLSPVGFVPPAWLARASHRRAVRDAGLPLTEDASHLWLTRWDVAISAPVFRWSARSVWRAGGSWVMAELGSLSRSRTPLLRIALHPRDLSSAAVRDSLQRTLDRCRRDRVPATYAQIAAMDGIGSAA